ncbi:MAG: tRNA (5-methylaminomethyl-2-thiouridine)(34)-methyltransferase MnmD [Pseudomonadota bacterium]
MATDQHEPVTWTANGVPISDRFDDPFYSLEDGLAETRHVFIEGNRLPARLTPGFTVAELGVGTGLNLLALAELARLKGTAPVRYTGFEAFPLAQGDLAQALSAFFPNVPIFAEALLTAWDPAGFSFHAEGVDATMIVGDARLTVRGWTGAADAWFLDGFSPAKNPELWEEDLMHAVAAHTRPGGTFATYTSAGHVRRKLDKAGFEVTRQPGFARKRHMTTGTLR